MEVYKEFSFFEDSLVTDTVLSPKSFLAPLRPGVKIATYSSRGAEYFLSVPAHVLTLLPLSPMYTPRL